MDLIAFAGLAGSGKDEAYQALVHSRRKAGVPPRSWVNYKFADALKRGVCAMLDLEYDIAERQKERPLNWLIYEDAPTYRDFLKVMGAAARNQINSEVWVRLLEVRIRQDSEFARRCGDRATVGVITDCRYLNEVEMVRRNGGKVIRVVRPGEDARGDVHESEMGIPPGSEDFLLVNDGSLPEYHSKVENLVCSLLTDGGYR